MGAGADVVHAGDECGAGGGADRGGGEGVVVAGRGLGEAVEIGRGGVAVSVAAEGGAHVLCGDPEDIRAICGEGGRGEK